MGWLASIGIALLSGVLGCVGAGLVATVCVDWYRITSREGAAGFYVVGLGLVGAMAGFAIGLVCARVIAHGANPSALKATGVALGAVAGTALVALGLAWLGADFPPTIEGREIEVAVEVRCPAGAAKPFPRESGFSHATITADTGQRRQSLGELQLEAVQQVGGHWVISATVPLTSSDPGRSLGVAFGDGKEQFFRLAIPGRPTAQDVGRWSEWMEQPTFGNLEKVPAGQALSARYRVQVAPPGE